MHEERFWNSFAEAAGVWKILFWVLVVSLIAYVVLRLLTRAVADRKTQRILLEDIKEAEAEARQASDNNEQTENL